MPLVANSSLPAFERLSHEGKAVIDADIALRQDIRELHIGLLNIMPDAALQATERQFYRLVGESNPIAQFFMHPFTLDELQRGEEAQAHIDRFYEKFSDIKEAGLDALIITGANVSSPRLSEQPFWDPLIEVIDWAYDNVTSTLCSCLATHAVLEFRYQQRRRPLGYKRWGVYSHRVTDRHHPLVFDVNTRFSVPHSRFNDVSTEQFQQAGLQVLVESEEAGVHLAVSKDLLRQVFFQGHPEYDTISLLKEYKREVNHYYNDNRRDYPLFPENYLGRQSEAILAEYQGRLTTAIEQHNEPPPFPEALISEELDNTWHDTAESVIGNWIGLVYQITHVERKLPFADGVDPDDPTGLLKPQIR